MIDKKEYIKKYNKEYWIKNKDKLKEQHKQWAKNNPEKKKDCSKQWKENNPEYIKHWSKDNPKKIKKYGRQYRKNNPGNKSEYLRQWRKKNPEKIKEYERQWQNIKYKIDIKYNLRRRISNGINLSLKNNKAGRHWENLVGYTLADLIKHLKKTIPKGYIWKDFLKGKLHIDHIIPIDAFNYSKPEHPDFKRCWDLENLQLLSAKENRIKHNKLEKSFQPALKIEL